jgi:hypothetical protein
VDGAAAVRAAAGPRTVANPGGGVAFNSSSNIQTLINANPANTIFVASATGAYTNFRGITYTTKHPRFYFPGAASSYSITGAGTSGESIGVDGGTGGLEVYGGTWKNYGTAASASFMRAINANPGSIIEDAVFTLNGQIGLGIYATSGQTSRVSHCTFSANGRYGVTGGGDPSVSALGAPTVEYCIIDNNNTLRLAPDIDAGGTKFVRADGMQCRYNWVKNNFGMGLWWDAYNRNVQCHNNVTENNVCAGIFYEISYGGTIIEHNYSFNDGKGDPTAPTGQGGINPPFYNQGISISCSPSDATQAAGGNGPGPNTTSEIRYNDIDNSGGGGGVGLLDHSGHAPLATRNWSIHHNRFYIRGTGSQGRTGLFDPSNLNLITLAGANNHFNYNEYHVATVGGTYYDCDGAKTLTTMRAAGHEINGTEVVI